MPVLEAQLSLSAVIDDCEASLEAIASAELEIAAKSQPAENNRKREDWRRSMRAPRRSHTVSASP